MRKLLIIFAFLSFGYTVSCRTEADGTHSLAAPPQSKAMEEALAAANAYYAKSTKDCGKYRYAWASGRSVVAYQDAAKDANVEILDGPNPYDGLEWRAMAGLNAKAYSLLGRYQEIMGWRLTYGKGIPGESVMIEKRKGQITYYDAPLSAVNPPALDCQ